MAIIAKDTKREFATAPEGLHQAVCCDVVDLGLVDGPWGQKAKVRLLWQLDVPNTETGKRFLVSGMYTLSLNEKARLRHVLEAWRGKKFTAQELQGFDLEKLIGVNCQVQIVHSLSDDGRIWSNVQACVPIGKGMTKLRVADDYIRMRDRDKRVADEPETENATDDSSVPF